MSVAFAVMSSINSDDIFANELEVKLNIKMIYIIKNFNLLFINN